MKNPLFLFASLLGMALFVVVVAVAFSKQAAKPLDLNLVRGDMRHSSNPSVSKVVIAEFSDFQCPACRSSAPFVKQLAQKYPNDVTVVYRHFPLSSIHNNATSAAIAAEAAGTFGKFWEYHDLLFQHQQEWEGLGGEQLKDTFIRYAQLLEISKDAFTNMYENPGELEKAITKDTADGNAIGVNATPTFYVNGEKVETSNLESVVEKFIKS